MKKVILFGGTFDPVHNGHVHCVTLLQKYFPEETIFIVPAANPPHKIGKHITSQKIRKEMLELAFASFDQVMIQNLEQEDTLNYTIDTLGKMEEMYKNINIRMVIGSDMFLSFHTWKDYKEIQHKVQLVVIAREKEHVDLLEAYGKSYGLQAIFILDDILETSSTEIRGVYGEQKSCPHKIPPDVEGYIRLHGVYE